MTDIEVAAAKESPFPSRDSSLWQQPRLKGRPLEPPLKHLLSVWKTICITIMGERVQRRPYWIAAVSIGVTGAVSGAVTLAAPYVISGLASAGITISIGVLATPVMVGGIVVYAGYSGYRLCKAAQPEPLESPSFLPPHYIK